MSLLYDLKIKAYRFANTKLGKSILRLFSGFVYISNLERNDSKNTYPFIVSITIDTESGYISKNDYRIWQKQNPEAYIGFYKGIENWRKLLSKYGAKATFFLSTNCFSAKGQEYNKIIKQLRSLLKGGHEIGLHMHPDSDLAVQRALNRKFRATSAKFYSKNEIHDLIKAGKQLIKKHLGINVTSFRWGNWALNADAAKALSKNGFEIDSSATPGITGHKNDEMAYDWSKVSRHYPWKLNFNDYQNTKHKNSNVLEIPIATFNFLGFRLRADPANSVLLQACFDYYYENSDRSKKPFVFVVISHSIESVHLDGSKTKVIDTMEEFLDYSKKFKDVKFSTLNKAHKNN